VSEQLTQALSETLDYLHGLSRDGVRPREARARLRHLQERYPEVEMDLLCEAQPFDETTHYDVLLGLGTEGTVSLSFCPDRGTPWVLRAVHRWSDMDLLRVNEAVLEVDVALASLDFIWDEARITDRLVNACLVREALAKDPITLSDAELQAAMDAYRRARKLYSADDTQRWMKRHGLTTEKLEGLVADEATVARLRQRIAAGRLESYFAEHRTDFDVAAVARFEVSDAAAARHVGEQLRTDPGRFYDLAEQHFQTEAAGAQVAPRDLFTILQRRDVAPALGAAVFTASAGDVVGPVRSDAGHVFLRVLSITPACLNEATRRAITTILFQEWLEQRRTAARIEWYWGSTGRTTSANGVS
jgi:putative peptide maturation system protein